MTVPHIFTNSAPGNKPDADGFMANYGFLEALIGGNLLGDPGLEDWELGTSFAGIATSTAINNFWSFVKAGTTPPTVTIAREGTTKDTGSYSLSHEITVAGSGDSHTRVAQTIKAHTKLAGQTIVFGAKVYASAANKVRLAVNDSGTIYYSEYHTGTPGWETLTVQVTVSAATSSLTVWAEANPADATGTFYLDSAFLFIVPSNLNAAAKAQLSFVSRVMRHLLTLETHAGNLDGFTYLFGKLWAGGSDAHIAVKSQTTLSVTTSAKTIISAGIGYGAFAFVVGDNATDFFADLVIFSYGGTPQVISSKTMTGSPAARTYTNAGTGVQQLEMGSGTYDIQVFCFDMSGR